jgi:uncharacterized Fe-S center protein
MDKIKTSTYSPEMCECGRLYKDRRDENGKMMCSACYNQCDVDTLKKLWSTPAPDFINKMFGKENG